MEYTLGLLFSPDHKRVALIEKARPSRMAGRLNGIGGKVEPGEHPGQAMAREFAEETGVEVPNWSLFAALLTGDSAIYIYRAFSNTAIDGIKTMTDEQVLVYGVDTALRHRALLPNLRVFIPLSLDTTGIKLPVTFLEDGVSARQI